MQVRVGCMNAEGIVEHCHAGTQQTQACTNLKIKMPLSVT